MRELIKKTQQKIYAIWRKAKQHISSFVGGQFKKRQTLTNKIKKIVRRLEEIKERVCKQYKYKLYTLLGAHKF